MWTEGYVTEIDYTHGYYRELSPDLLRFACLIKGVHVPKTPTLRYLELGFGQGLSLNIHAAACPGEYWGTDFNPAQVSNAQSLLSASGANARLLDDSFAELAARSDLPSFDIIGLHGIWSWISPDNQRMIVDIVRRHLAVGGLLYISYNTLPGWASAMPFRHLMQLHAELAGADAQGMIGKIDAALQFSQQVVDGGALYFRANPGVAERLKKVSEQNRHYLAHEYFNADWYPMHFSEVAGMLENGKVGFAASAHLLDHIDSINLGNDSIQHLNGIRHPILRESVRDYYVNQQFRRDVFIKGLRFMNPLEQQAALRSIRVILLSQPDEVPLKVKGVLGEANLQEGVYMPILEALATGQSVKSLGDLEKALAGKVGFSALVQAMMILLGNGNAGIAQDDEVMERSVPHCHKLNLHLCSRARYNNDIGFLASPVTGGGLPVPRFHQLFLLAVHQGHRTPEDWAKFAWEILNRQNQRIVKEGKTLESSEENLAELTSQAREFETKKLPVLNALKISLAEVPQAI
jgi:hypothetical protein